MEIISSILDLKEISIAGRNLKPNHLFYKFAPICDLTELGVNVSQFLKVNSGELKERGLWKTFDSLSLEFTKEWKEARKKKHQIWCLSPNGNRNLELMESRTRSLECWLSRMHSTCTQRNYSGKWLLLDD